MSINKSKIEMKLSKLLRVIHRDFSYFFTGMILLYAITGILLNHARDWNPYYSLDVKTVKVELPTDTNRINDNLLLKTFQVFGETEIRSYYYPDSSTLKVFLKNGTATVNLNEQIALIENSYRRPILYQLNLMHKNRPKAWWTWFSDIFAIGLITITLTGLFLIKGKNGITRRGAILVAAGLILPILAIFLFF
ncbi:PepSY-associated TM helix domain-containing protein [Tenuifilum thalassicum]|uniref:Peptidase n=1 Tax=Tenuifilum thalassicum TaxID=2590900 RepID=A0A7D4CG66_9BACT|nr:PepSY-associated TM helix domain-containing protein [Tenuifilum thalassicum]QKG79626.1 hypothetical protein FHG85_04900 [Tenuifilum thalassicum]